MKTLIAVDGSSYSKRAIEYVKQHKGIFGNGSSITVINVQTALPPHVAGRFSKENIATYYGDGAEKDLKPARRAFKADGIEITEVTKVGNPGDEIAAFAKRGKFDLIIMGSHGRSLFRNLVLGSVATRVFAACTVPVLIIR